MAKVAKRLWKAGVMTWWYDMMTYDMMMGWRDDVMAWWRDDMMTWCHDVSLTWCHDDMTWWRDDTMTWSYILKVGVPGDRVSANFVHFPPKFRLGKQKPSRPHCTNASPSFCRRCFVFNINTSHIDLLFFDNLTLKNTDLCNLRIFVAFFCRNLCIFSAKQTPPIHPL